MASKAEKVQVQNFASDFKNTRVRLRISWFHFNCQVGKSSQGLQIRDYSCWKLIAKAVAAKLLNDISTCLRGMSRCFLDYIQSFEEFLRLRSILFMEVDHVIELSDTPKTVLSTCDTHDTVNRSNARFKVHLAQIFRDVPF